MILTMTNESYHAHPSISSSDVKAVATRSLAHWKYRTYKASPAFALGSAVHALVLEPQKNLVVRGPEDRRGAKWKDASLAADLDGKILLTEGDYDLAAEIANAVLAHPAVGSFLADSEFVAEASFFADDGETGANIKCRPDGYIPHAGVVFDIKTTRDASPEGFPKELRNYGYDLQAAFYLRTLREAGFLAKKFIFVAVEKEPPYAVGLHVMTDRYLDHANERITRTLEKINAATIAGDYTTGWPMINDIDLPRWQVDPEADVFDDTIDF
jgi:exodeoxyribonuclease VIII